AFHGVLLRFKATCNQPRLRFYRRKDAGTRARKANQVTPTLSRCELHDRYDLFEPSPIRIASAFENSTQLLARKPPQVVIRGHRVSIRTRRGDQDHIALIRLRHM